MREELCAEAIRLARLLVELMPDEEEAVGLLALLLLIDARRAARVAADGDPVLLPDQDRERWDRGLIDEGHALVRWCLGRDRPGPYQLQAAIQAVHSSARARPPRPTGRRSSRSTTSCCRAAHACRRPQPGRRRRRGRRRCGGARGRGRAGRGHRDAHCVLPVARYSSDLLRRLGRTAEAAAEYDEAIGLSDNAVEQRMLAAARASMAATEH